jgi:conjugal transfer pilus assembly protein TraB
VKTDDKTEGVMLPAGSYVKAKIMTGVDVPEGKTYPVLMVLDYSYVAPNDHKIDLSGCFMIAKAEGDLSTERVQMQATKMSCVSKKGKMFEREVSGFIADDRDGSFAMQGTVNSKQGRVAAMAFMASVVDGVGKAVQAAQTTQSVNPLGGSSSVLTGDSAKYMVAGGASNAAGMVAQWYLQQAQALAPTVAVGSGRDVWIVMKDKVNLPEEFFKKEGKSNEGIYSYFTRVLD